MRQNRARTLARGFRAVMVVLLAACGPLGVAEFSEGAAPANDSSIFAGPYLVGWTHKSIAVRWEAVRSCDTSAVVFSSDGDNSTLPGIPVLPARDSQVKGAICQVGLPALEPCDEYRYLFKVVGTEDEAFEFKAPPPTGGVCSGGMKVAIIGDTRTHHDIHARLASAIERFSPHIVLHTGDLVDHNDRIDEWRRYFQVERNILPKALLAVAPGNHEVLPEGEKSPLGAWLMDRYFKTAHGGGTGHHTFDFGVLHVIVLDTYFGEQLDNGGMDWLKGHLESLPDDRIVLVMLHEPPVTFGRYEPGEELVYLRRVLVENEVDAVLAGHQHLYEHFVVGKTHFVTSGGGGAELHPERANVIEEQKPWLKKHRAVFQWVSLEIDSSHAMHFKAIDIEGAVFEEWTVRREE